MWAMQEGMRVCMRVHVFVDGGRLFRFEVWGLLLVNYFNLF